MLAELMRLKRLRRHRRNPRQDTTTTMVAALLDAGGIGSHSPNRRALCIGVDNAPLTTVGSNPSESSSAATMVVVVVLPWVPAMATAALQPHQLGQHFGAPHDRQPRRSGPRRFDVVGFTAEE